MVDRVLSTTGTWKSLALWRFHFFSTDLVPKYWVFWQHYSVRQIITFIHICNLLRVAHFRMTIIWAIGMAPNTVASYFLLQKERGKLVCSKSNGRNGAHHPFLHPAKKQWVCSDRGEDRTIITHERQSYAQVSCLSGGKKDFYKIETMHKQYHVQTTTWYMNIVLIQITWCVWKYYGISILVSTVHL